ncbi:MAG: T9SS type A sorting domain-containing protein [Bacteroidota bacterium]
MKKLIFTISLSFAAFGLFSQSMAPDVIASSGGYHENTNASISWTIGECVIETFQGSTAIMTQGFHQTNLDITEVERNEFFDFSCQVYPNPVSDFITIDILNSEFETYTVEIYDANGKRLINKKLSGNSEKIDFSSYPAAAYFVKIQSPGGENLRSFKVIKSK